MPFPGSIGRGDGGRDPQIDDFRDLGIRHQQALESGIPRMQTGTRTSAFLLPGVSVTTPCCGS
jgi:hypothetical protein